MTPHKTRNRGCLLSRSAIMPALFMVAVGIRLLPWDHIFVGATTYLADGDCYVRLRKILVYLNAFPATFVHDYFQGYPKGTGVISPPVMEYLLAGLAFPFRDSPMLAPLLQKVVALLPPVVGGVTVVLFYRFVREFLSRTAAVIAALFLAFMPPHVDATLLGRFDNEMVEPLLFLMVCLLYLRAACGERCTLPWVVTGCASAVYLVFWRGALFPLSLLGADLLLRVVAPGEDREPARMTARGAAILYAAAAAVIALICMIDPWRTGRLFTFNVISFFHVSVFAMAAFIFALLRLPTGEGRRTAALRYGIPAGVIIGALILFRGNLTEGLKVIVGGNAWIDSIGEYVPGFSGSDTVSYYGIFALISPFALLLLRRLDSLPVQMKRFLILWTLFMLAATAARLRFACYFALNAALLAGVAVQFVSVLAERIRKSWPVPAVVVLIMLLQLPTLHYFLGVSREGRGVGIREGIEEAMVWLRDRTPIPGDAYRPAVPPGYGVMARWDVGSYIESIGLRPAIATGYGSETYGLDESARFFLATDDGEMRSILERNRARYAVVEEETAFSLPYFATLTGDRRVFVRQERNSSGGMDKVTTPECFTLAFLRLLLADGSLTAGNGLYFAPVEGMRLVYESSQPGTLFSFPWKTTRVKIFEAVAGADLVVSGRPGAVVDIAQPVESNRGRRFVYRNRKVLDETGHAGFRIVYRSKSAPDVTGAIAPVTVFAGNGKLQVRVSDRDVDEARTITVSMR